MAVRDVTFYSSQYTIQTDVYQGPLDILLELIEKAELDITALSIAQVTDQFLDYVDSLKEDDITEVSAFIAIASRLLLIKSTVILSKSDTVITNLDEDSGESLAQQLIVYREFKRLSEFLGNRESNEMRSLERLSPLDADIQPRLDLSGITIQDLAKIAAQVFSRIAPKEDLSAVMKSPRLRIKDKIRSILEKLKFTRQIKFSAITDSHSKVEKVVTFLAMLELIKRRIIIAEQDSLFSDIVITKEDGNEISDDSVETEFSE